MPFLQGPEFYISKRVGKAIIDYTMLSDGDKVAVAVSGGRDSLTLLRVLHDRRRFVPIRYELLAVHVDAVPPKRSASRALAGYCRKLGVAYHAEKILPSKGTRTSDAGSFWCSNVYKKAVCDVARRYGCNKVALGQHHDDIIQGMLSNFLLRGVIAPLQPKQEAERQKVVVIRPLAYVEESLISRFSRTAGFPKQRSSSELPPPKDLAAMSRVIRDLKKTCPDVKKNIFRSIRRVNTEYLL